MKGIILKNTAIFSNDVANIDRTNGIIKNVLIASYGMDKNDEFMDEVFLKSLADAGNADAKGLKCRFGHPISVDSFGQQVLTEGIGSYVGRFKNFRFDEVKKQTTADLYVDPVAKNSPSGDIYTYVLDMATSNSDMFGGSIFFLPKESEKITIKSDGIDKQVSAIRLNLFYACDLVDMPAATESLFKSTELTSENEDEALNEFLLKYTSYKIKNQMEKTKKSLFERFKAKADELIKELSGETQKSIAATGSDGSEISIITDKDAPAEGDVAQSKDGKAAADGDYNHGDKIVSVAGGKVAAVKAKVDPEEEEEETEDEEKIAKEFADLSVKSIKLEQTTKDQAAELTSLKSAHDSLKSEIEKIKKSISTDYVPKNKKNFVPPDKKKEEDEDDKPLTVAQRAAKTAH